MSTPMCGAQMPSGVPDPFDWWPFAAAGVVGAALAYVYANGIPLINGIIAALTGAAPVLPSIGLAASFAGAAAIFTLVLYYALKPDGCIRSTPKGQAICLSGIVEDTVDLSDTAVAVLAPFAMGPAGMFDLVVKSIYFHYVTTNAYWVYCNPLGAAMLPCIIKSKTACGAKIGALIGAAVGAVAGIVIGFIAAAAIGCAASGPFYLLCLLVALLIAAIVAAAITYAGAMIGGWIGQGIAALGSDPVGDAWEALEPGAIVTTKGNWVTNSDIGNNELFYTTFIGRTGDFAHGPSFTNAEADTTAAADCPIAPDPIK